MYKASVITPVWNRSDLTQRFLAQNWRQYEKDDGVQFIIVNNASTDNTEGILSYWQHVIKERLLVLGQEKNIGFGPANNIGAKMADGDVLVFLSNDVIIGGDYLTPIVETVQKDVSALYGTQLFSHDTGWNKFKGVGVIPYLAGWCVAADLGFWEAFCMWDPRYYPCDYEDVDLSYHVVKLGFPLNEIKGLPLKHESGQSAQALEGGRLAITMESQRKFCEKWGIEIDK